MSKENKLKTDPPKKGLKIIRALWFMAGTISLVLGAIGIVLPILPTTPFLLASAACYYKSSSRMHNWLLNNKWFGEYIRNYQEGKGIPLKTKITALTVLWVTIGVSTFFFLEPLLPPFLVLPMQLTMIIVAIVVTIYMLRLPTYKKT
ncbi:YbaN family protein [Candidatus Bathyarchaeota archaeon]|nr:YbaN family protein [Candidatus Bathyarchaeota archaeon]